MTVNVKEFIKFLKTQDQDAIVQVAIKVERGNFEETKLVDFDPAKKWDHWDFVDFTKNSFVNNNPDHPAFNKKILEIGCDS